MSHRAGIDPRTARDYLRVARALPGLPLIAEAMATGELSYCKARALTRIARPETEAEMLDFARMTTVIQLDVAVSAYRRCEAESLRKAHERHASRSMTPDTDELGMSGYDVRLSPEDGAVLAAALDLAIKLLEGGAVSPEHAQNGSREPLFGDGHDPATTQAVEDEPLRGGSHEPLRSPEGRETEDQESDDESLESGSREPLFGALDDEAWPVHPPRPGDEAGFIDGVFTLFDPEEGHWVDGEWVWFDVRTGLLPHHSLEWVADQGPTDIDVLVNLCRGHHWAVHEGGCRVVPDAEVGFRFYGAAGDEIVVAPAQWAADTSIEQLNDAAGITPVAAPTGGSGEQMDLELTVWALLNSRAAGMAPG